MQRTGPFSSRTACSCPSPALLPAKHNGTGAPGGRESRASKPATRPRRDPTQIWILATTRGLKCRTGLGPELPLAGRLPACAEMSSMSAFAINRTVARTHTDPQLVQAKTGCETGRRPGVCSASCVKAQPDRLLAAGRPGRGPTSPDPARRSCKQSVPGQFAGGQRPPVAARRARTGFNRGMRASCCQCQQL